MAFSDIGFRDVTRDLDAKSETSELEMRKELAACGFRQVGLLKVTTEKKPSPQALKAMGTGADADLLRRAVEQGEIDEILTDPGQKMFAVVENNFGGPLVCFRTLFENGMVVETTKKPARAPEVSLFPDAPFLQGDFIFSFIMRMMKLAIGKPALWVRENWPQAGYYLELVDTQDALSIWRRHQERVNQLAQSSDVAVMPHDSLDLYVGICRRTYQIHEHHGRWRGILTNVAMGLFLVLFFSIIIVFPIITGLLKKSGQLPSVGITITIFLVLILAVSLLGVLVFPLIGLINTRIVPRLPGPKLQTAAELLNRYRLTERE